MRDLASKQANVGISYGRQLKKYFGFRLGYSYQLSQYRGSDLDPQWVGTHGGDIGLNFGRNGALELNRRTRLSFGVGVGSGRGLRPGERLHYTVTGNAGLTRDVGRTFQASLPVQPRPRVQLVLPRAGRAVTPSRPATAACSRGA